MQSARRAPLMAREVDQDGGTSGYQGGSYAFGRFVLHPAQRRLSAEGRVVRVGARGFDLLVALVEGRGRTLSRAELIARVWPGRVVEEQNLHVQIVGLRKLVGAEAILTIPGRGYRWVQPVDDRSPAAGGDLHGRAADLDAASALLGRCRLLTLLGPPGIGKSRLARALAARWSRRPGAVVGHVELLGQGDSPSIPSLAAEALALPKAAAIRDAATLAAAVDSAAPLLVLEHGEHGLDAVARFAVDLLDAAPRARLLVTGREPLCLAHEQRYRVQPLVADAARLFVERARAAGAALPAAAEEDAAIARLCGQLDGLPLAIELAAATLPQLGLHALAARLEERLDLFADPAREPRHRTLRDALAASHERLAPAERLCLRRLGAFTGPFTLEAAQQLVVDTAIDDWGVLDLLGALVDKSLVMVDAGEPPRYRLLHAVRALALEQLAAHGETEPLRPSGARRAPREPDTLTEQAPA